MSSKRHVRRKRERLKEKMCGNKVKYDNQTKAVAGLLFLKNKMNVSGLHTYICNFCNFWHIGHKQGVFI